MPMVPGMEPGTRAFQLDVADGHLSAFVSQEPSTKKWHMSISHRRNVLDATGLHVPGRYPAWDEIRDARYALLPNKVTMALLLPPKGEYVNIMSTCFHLYEIDHKDRT